MKIKLLLAVAIGLLLSGCGGKTPVMGMGNDVYKITVYSEQDGFVQLEITARKEGEEKCMTMGKSFEYITSQQAYNGGRGWMVNAMPSYTLVFKCK